MRRLTGRTPHAVAGRGFSRLAIALVLGMAALSLAGTLGQSPSARLAAATLNIAPTSTLATAGDPVVAAAGDIACDPKNTNFKGGLGSSQSCHQKAVSDLLVNAGLTGWGALIGILFVLAFLNVFLALRRRGRPTAAKKEPPEPPEPSEPAPTREQREHHITHPRH